ncbi:MAG: hypothetical protein GAK28_03944 [Luteibacter sp.]|nr:MAG: hypothetical protein GAK28_03944 [Luteibacter sp.]
MLAGVGTTWYTWLEQGRDVHPSGDVLLAIAAALRLDAAEREHLFVLFRVSPDNDRAVEPERVEDPIRRMLVSLQDQPAFVRGRRWDILAWNRAADVVFGPYEALEGDQRNALHLLFANPGHRAMLTDWEPVARAAMAMFRTDFARHAGDLSFIRLIENLSRASEAFAQWWDQQAVLRPQSGEKRINHPTAGPMTFEYSSLGIGDSPDLKLIVLTPSQADGTLDALRRLL